MSRSKEQVLTIRIGAQVSEALNGINKLGDRVDRLGRNMQRSGRMLSRNLTAPLVALGATGFKVAGDFEQAMGRMEGLVGIQRSQLDGWTGDIRSMAVEYGSSAGKAAEALFFITSAGLRGSDAMDALEVSLKGSAAGLGEVRDIADLATSAMNAYGPDVLSAADATDVLTAAVTAGKLEPAELAGAMGKVLPIASNMGVRFDEVGAAMASMSRTGTTASEAATQLRSIMTSLLKPTAQAEATLAEMGMSAGGLRQQIREDGLLATLQGLSREFGSNEDAAAQVFGNVRALSGVMDMMGASADTTAEIFGSLEGASGALDSAFEVQQGGMFELQRTWAALQDNLLEIGNIVLPPITTGFQHVTTVLSKVTAAVGSLSPELRNVIVIVGGVVAAIGPFLLIMGKVVAVFGLVLNPVGLVITAIVTLTTVVVALVRNWDRFLEFWVDMWVRVNRISLNAIGSIIEGLENLTSGIPGLSRVVSVASDGFKRFAEQSMASTARAADFLKDRIVDMGGELQTTAEEAQATATATQELGQSATTANESLGEVVTTAGNLSPQLKRIETEIVGVNHGLGLLKPTTQRLEATVSASMGATTRSVGQFADSATDDLEDLKDSGVASMSEIGQTMQSIGNRGFDAMFDFAMGAKDAIRSFVQDSLRQLARLAANRLFKLALGGLTGGSGGVLASVFGGFFADGGVLGSGQFGIAGEAGPELITAGAAPVRITPLSGVGGGSGGGNAGDVASEILRRIGPPPSVHTPEGVAADGWWRRAFDALARDGQRRGSL